MLYYLQVILYNIINNSKDYKTMINGLIEYLNKSKTAYQAVEEAAGLLIAAGFTELSESKQWNLNKNGKYFVIRDGSALIAVKTGNLKNYSYNIAASHTDSPCFKIKQNPEIKTENYMKLNVERYGGGLYYTWLDRPLTVAGRIVVADGEKIKSVPYVSDKNFVIPSVAIHFNRNANDGIKFNPQTDLCPISSLFGEKQFESELEKAAGGKEVIDADLFIVNNENAFFSGFNNEFLSSSRIDNLTSAYSSVEAIISAKPKCIDIAFLADNEEVGSGTKQGAGSKFLYDVIERINSSFGKNEEDLKIALSSSFMLSCDNAHATHPNHPELSDPTNKVLMNNGIVIKHHANQNYTTDAVSSSLIKSVLKKANVQYQDFFMRSDLPCGGTLGTISSRQLSVRSADIGIAQLAMHSNTETFGVKDFGFMLEGVKAFYECAFLSDGFSEIEII